MLRSSHVFLPIANSYSNLEQLKYLPRWYHTVKTLLLLAYLGLFFLFNEWCFLINSDIVDLVHIHGWKRGNIGHYHVEKCLLPVINPLILMWCICTKCYEFSKCWPVLFQHISSELYSLSVYHILSFNFSECGLAFCKNVWKREVFFKMSCLSNDDEDDKFLSPICDFSAFILGISLLHQASNLLKILKVNFTACSRLGKNIGN